ncbi:hypothetical protein [Streptomyces sp. NPDC006463]|uniref:hypothetical protein n=1 Tax=Streptomyces sp. NPDC006463 TaxID=3364746 RepID=UPI0036BAAC37
MTTSARGQPLIPQPPSTVTELRQAVAQVSPAALPAFTRELDLAADQSRQGSDLAPLRRFIAQWAAFVQVQRQLRLAEELRRWEDTAATGDASRARRAAAEIGRILDAAHAALAAHLP